MLLNVSANSRLFNVSAVCDSGGKKCSSMCLQTIKRTVRQWSPVRQKFKECTIVNPALLLLMKHLVIGQRQKAPNFSAFHWSQQGSLVSIGQHFVAMRVVHLPERTETSLITKPD